MMVKQRLSGVEDGRQGRVGNMERDTNTKGLLKKSHKNFQQCNLPKI